MSSLKKENLISTISSSEFIGRTKEIEKILLHSKKTTNPGGLLVLSSPGMGLSEILKQVYDRLFYDLEIIPVYFSFKSTDMTIKKAALRFLQTFLHQTVSFRRQDKAILDSSPDNFEVADLAFSIDSLWVNSLLKSCKNDNYPNNEDAFIKNCLSAPLRATAHNAMPFVMIDDLHEAENLEGETNLLEDLKAIYDRADFPFVLAGRRRFLYNFSKTGDTKLNESEILEIKPLNFKDTGILAENLAAKYNVKINPQTRDLIVRKFSGNPTFINFLFQTAHQNKYDLNDFQKVARVYAKEIFGGRIKNYYKTILDKIAPNFEIQKNIIKILNDSFMLEGEKIPFELWKNHMRLANKEFYRVNKLLNIHEIIRISSYFVEAMDENEVLSDYINARFKLEIGAQPRVLVIAEALSKYLKRAPDTLAKFHKTRSAIGLRKLLGTFDRQKVPTDLIDYADFEANLRDAEDSKVWQKLKHSTKHIYLPQITFSAATGAFYPLINKFTEIEQTAVALGYKDANYTDENEIVWLAAEIDVEFEADKETTEFWCDRFEMVALMCGFTKYQIWLIAPEGFTLDALETLKQRNAYGSSRKQIDLLKRFLKFEKALGERSDSNEYELIMAFEEGFELVATNAVFEIARQYNFPTKATNQIKTALVEALINTSEYASINSLKILQKFKVEANKLTITVSEQGISQSGKRSSKISASNDRLSWGRGLIITLMDEVIFEQVGESRSISMTKYL